MPPAPDPALLAGLRKALTSLQPLPLKGKGEGYIFPGGKAGDELVKAAIEQGLLTTEKVKIKAGKSAKAVECGLPTDRGRAFVLEADSPKAVLEALEPSLKALAAGNDAGHDAEAARAIEKAGVACVAAVNAAFEKLTAAVDAAFERMGKAVTEAVVGGRSGPAVDPVQILGLLKEALARVGSASPAAALPARPSPQNEAPRGPTASAPVPAGSDLRRSLRQAYDELRLYKEFRDGLVEIPRLYHEAARRIPGLTVAQFHAELQALSKERKVELHKLNEVASARDRHLAIERDDRLYYYLLWE